MVIKWLVPILMAIAGLCIALYSFERHSSVKARAEARAAIETAQSLSQDLSEAHESFRVDLDAIVAAQKNKDGLVAKADIIKERVDAVSKKVEAGQLSESAADAAYIDSMWETYCEGSNDPACSSRSSGARH